MSCSNPLLAHQCADGDVVLNVRPGMDVVRDLWLPCGRCAMCRATKAGQWTTRLVQESFCHARSCAVTLTYAPEHVDLEGCLHKRHVQLFLKSVRFEASERKAPPVRFHCRAEYSPVRLRPHYHVSLFGYWPPDAQAFGKSRAGNPQWSSATLTRLWGRGHVTFQVFTPGAARYVAGHDASKLVEDSRAGPIVDGEGRRVGFRAPEFSLMSRRPGLGGVFVDRYSDELLAVGAAVVAGRKVPLPRYVVDRLESIDPDRVSEIRAQQSVAARLAMPDSTRERLAVREQCAAARAARMARVGVERG